jgi:hypothetical protein
MVVHRIIGYFEEVFGMRGSVFRCFTSEQRDCTRVSFRPP